MSFHRLDNYLMRNKGYRTLRRLFLTTRIGVEVLLALLIPSPRK
jgi:hypothetical protein